MSQSSTRKSEHDSINNAREQTPLSSSSSTDLTDDHETTERIEPFLVTGIDFFCRLARSVEGIMEGYDCRLVCVEMQLRESSLLLRSFIHSIDRSFVHSFHRSLLRSFNALVVYWNGSCCCCCFRWYDEQTQQQERTVQSSVQKMENQGRNREKMTHIIAY